jgi:hypothetical protein
MTDLERSLLALRDSLDISPSTDLLESVRRRHARRTMRRRFGIAAIAVGTTAIVGVPGILVARRHRSGVSADRPASGRARIASLDADLAALAAAPGADQPQPTGPFAYTHSRTRYLAMSAAAEPASGDTPSTGSPAEMYSYLYGADREIWLDKSSAGHLRSKPLPPVFLHPGDEAIYQRKGITERGTDTDLMNGDQPVNVPNPSFDASGLPTEPAAMRQHLRDVGSGVEDDNERTFTAGEDLLRETILPLNVRVAVLRALLLIPDVTVVDGLTDLNGRPGTGVGRVERGTTRRDVIVDVESGTLLGERDAAAVDGEFGPRGTVIGQTAILDSGFVGAVGERPKH